MIHHVFKWLRRLFLTLVLGGVLLVGLSAASNLGLERRSENPSELSPVQKARVAEAFRLKQRLGDGIWPGWAETQIPQIVYNEKFAFLMGLADPELGWYQEPGHRFRGREWESPGDEILFGGAYFRQPLEALDKGPQAFAVRVGERWTGSVPTQEWARLSLAAEIRSQLPGVLAWIPPYRLLGRMFFRGGEHQVSLILHESFHAYQGMQAEDRFAAAEAAVALERRYPWDDPEMDAAWYRELGLLADALSEETRNGAESLTREFLVVRGARRRGLSAELVAFEDAREWLEGLAKYVELKSILLARRAVAGGEEGGAGKGAGAWGEPPTGPYVPHPALAGDPEFDHYDHAEKAFSREVGQLRRVGGQGGVRFYYSGMAMAFLLDRLGQPDWKARVMGSQLSLSAALMEALSMNGRLPPPS